MSLYEKYLDTKKVAATAVIFVKCGDFWETFGNDAILVSTLLDLPLTHRNTDDNGLIPNVGIVYHEFDNKVNELQALSILTYV